MYIDQFAPYFDNIILLGDFNAEVTEDAMTEFCGLFNLKSLIKVPTCYKNLDNLSCIDLILTNRFNSFQNSIAIESGLLDFHKLTVTHGCFKSHIAAIKRLFIFVRRSGASLASK